MTAFGTSKAAAPGRPGLRLLGQDVGGVDEGSVMDSLIKVAQRYLPDQAAFAGAMLSAPPLSRHEPRDTVVARAWIRCRAFVEAVSSLDVDARQQFVDVTLQRYPGLDGPHGFSGGMSPAEFMAVTASGNGSSRLAALAALAD